ncbi:MAG: non-heme iron oxygenase ferredoxin subunit [Duganella sp.]
MSKKIFLLKSADLQPGCARKVEAEGGDIAVFNLEGRFYATSNMCTHATASLADGEIVGDDCIACPVHFGEFHIPTGQALSFPCTVDLRTYKVLQEGEDIYADLDEESEEAASAI